MPAFQPTSYRKPRCYSHVLLKSDSRQSATSSILRGSALFLSRAGSSVLVHTQMLKYLKNELSIFYCGFLKHSLCAHLGKATTLTLIRLQVVVCLDSNGKTKKEFQVFVVNVFILICIYTQTKIF